MDFIINNWQGIVGVITAVVTAASIIVKLTPTQKDDEILGKIMKLLNLIAINPKK